MKLIIDKGNADRQQKEAALQTSENQKNFLVDLINKKLESASIEDHEALEKTGLKEILGKLIAEDDKSKVGFKLTLIRRDGHPIRVKFKPLQEEI